MKVETLADQLFFVTAYLTATTATGTAIGTGFVYGVETNQGTAHFLVTNRHVLAGASELTVAMIASKSGGPWLGTRTQVTLHAFGEHGWFGHPNNAIDVAAMPLWQVFNEMHRLGGPPYFKSVAPSFCLTTEGSGELDSIEEVTFVGYPSGLFDAKNLLPVARRGSTATPMSVDYQGLPAFLIDAAVFPGSSGSPVFLVNRGFTVTRAGGLTVGGGRILCLGVLAAVHARPVEGKIFEVPTRLGVTFDEPIGLGIVFRASTFDECVDPILENAALTRVADAPPAPAGVQTEGPTEADRQVGEDVPPTG